MLKKLRRILCAIMVIVLTVGAIQYIAPTPKVQAITQKQKQKKKKALKAYKKFLSTDSFKWGSTEVKGSDASFAVKDLDGDKVSELIVSCTTCAADGYERVYAYKNGKVKELVEANHGNFTYYPKQHIIKYEFGQTGVLGTIYYKLSKGKTKEIARRGGDFVCVQDDWIEQYKSFYVNEKKATKAKYNKKVKKLKLKGKYTPKQRKATKENLKKYLK